MRHKEGRQTYKWYADGNGGHKWLGGERKIVYLFCIDDSISPSNAEKYKMYAEAIYPNAKIAVIRQGETLPNGARLPGSLGEVMPKNFLKSTKVVSREGYCGK